MPESAAYGETDPLEKYRERHGERLRVLTSGRVRYSNADLTDTEDANFVKLAFWAIRTREVNF